MIGFQAEFYLACDGEELLGRRFDGNACELTSDDVGACNESVTDGGYDAAPSESDIGHAVLAALGRVQSTNGWVREPTFRMDFHLCPACAVAWAELSGDEREQARAARWLLAKQRVGAA